MPKFVKVGPKDVAVGRSRAAVAARAPYVRALKAGAAGRIELDSGIEFRSSSESPRSLVWKRTGQV